MSVRSQAAGPVYFAYGSNMSEPRLRRRVASARFWDIGRMTGRALRFHKVGRDGSGKCDVVTLPQGEVYGVLYQVTVADLSALDRIEGRGLGYERETVRVERADGAIVVAQTYVATVVDPGLKPFDWYLRHVVQGARAARLPDPYRTGLAGVQTVEDADQQRVRRELAIYD